MRTSSGLYRNILEVIRGKGGRSFLLKCLFSLFAIFLLYSLPFHTQTLPSSSSYEAEAAYQQLEEANTSVDLSNFNDDSFVDSLLTHHGYKSRPKFFLDCGANTGSTYKLFHEIWPDADQYHMISFEIEPRLGPYYASFENHTAIYPMGVSDKDGKMEASLEPPWSPDSSKKSSWGGGSLFTFGGKKEWRGLDRHITVPTFDLSSFILRNFILDDHVVLKIDIEGAEYTVIDKMLNDNTFHLVDKFFLEFHDWQPSGWTKQQKHSLRSRMKAMGVSYSQWEAEYPTVPEAGKWKPEILGNLPVPAANEDNSKCHGHIKLAIAVGMNARKAKRLIATVLSHNATKNLQIGLLFYRDFIYEYPDLVYKWSKDPGSVIGLRGDSPRPQGFFEKMVYKPEIEMSIISSLRQLVRTTGYSTRYFIPDFPGNRYVDSMLKSMNLKTPSSLIWLPPKDPNELDITFFSKRSVEKIPPLLRYTYQQMEKAVYSGKKGSPTVVLDSDFDETWISSVFLLDYFQSLHAVLHQKTLTGFTSCLNQ